MSTSHTFSPYHRKEFFLQKVPFNYAICRNHFAHQYKKTAKQLPTAPASSFRPCSWFLMAKAHYAPVCMSTNKGSFTTIQTLMEVVTEGPLTPK